MELPDLSNGPKPHQFTLSDESNELYMIGSEAGAYMGLFRGAIYKKFPQLWRRLATADERKRIYTLLENSKVKIANNITLVKASDIQNIVLGHADEYRIKNTSFIDKKLLHDSQLNLNINGSFWPSNVILDINYESMLTVSDFNIFSIPISQLSTAKRVSLSKKRIRYCSLFLEWKYSKNINEKLDTIKDELIPIRLFIKYDPYLLSDVIMWNKSTEFLLDYSTFAMLLCDDYDLPADVFVPAIVHLMKSQVERYNQDKHLIQIYKNSKKNLKDTVAIINIDITIGETRLQDKFCWDIDHNNPTDCINFAEIAVKELNLSPEFITPISVCILGQINWHRHMRYLKLIDPFLHCSNNSTLVNTHNDSSDSTQCFDVSFSQLSDKCTARNIDHISAWIPIVSKISDHDLVQHQKDIEKQMLRIDSCISASNNNNMTNV